MDDERDDFEEKMDKDDVGSLHEEEPPFGVGEEDDDKDEESEDKLLDTFGFTVEDDEPLTDF